MAITAKQKHKNKLLFFMADPENEFPMRCKFVDVIGITKQTMYKHFTPAELSEIENEGLIMRRTRCAAISARVDKGLIKKAEDGDAAACKLYYQRIEHWSEKTISDQNLKISLPSGIEVNFSTEAMVDGPTKD